MALIAIYDSGVGGLSVYLNVVHRCPEHDYVFLSDNHAFPYGDKPEHELLKRAQAVVRRLDQCFSPDVLIVACNTASTVVLPHLREEFDFHVIGVVPAVKPAAQLSRTKKIGLLATPATIDRPYTDELINEFAIDCQVTKVGSSALVMLAEDKLYGRPLDESILGTILKPIIDQPDIDVVVLACTHFPLLKGEIASELKRCKRQISLVDSGEAIANRLFSLGQIYTLPFTNRASRLAIVTDPSVDAQFSAQLQRMGFDKLQHLAIE